MFVYRPRQSEAHQFASLVDRDAFLPFVATKAVGAAATFDCQNSFVVANANTHRALRVIADVTLRNMRAGRSKMLVRPAHKEFVLYFHLKGFRNS